MGPGGVGKTTTAAAIGLSTACEGRHSLVLTIDPARRLVDSLGVGPLGHDPRLVPEERLWAAGLKARAPVEAMMLDPRCTFESIVRRFAPDAETRARLMRNPIYQQIAGRLAGTQEYAAMAELQRIHRQGRYDVIVLDTPPSANALDFLEAPGRLAEALDSPALQWFIRPTLSAGEFSLKMLGMGGVFVLRRLARLTGGAFLEDVAHFLVEFNAVLGGFRRRAEEVEALLRDPAVGFVVVVTPEPGVVDEGLEFVRRLRGAGMPLAALVVNRVRNAPRSSLDRIEEQFREVIGPQAIPASELRTSADALHRTCRDLRVLGESDALEIGRLRETEPGAPLLSVPLLVHDVHDLRGLSLVAERLLRDEDVV